MPVPLEYARPHPRTMASRAERAMAVIAMVWGLISGPVAFIVAEGACLPQFPGTSDTTSVKRWWMFGQTGGFVAVLALVLILGGSILFSCITLRVIPASVEKWVRVEVKVGIVAAILWALLIFFSLRLP